MAEDLEWMALRQAWEAIAPLNSAARRRTLNYLRDRCAEDELLERQVEASGNRCAGDVSEAPGLNHRWRRQFELRVAEHRIRSDSERVLVVAAAIQQLDPEGFRPLRSREIHRVLKEMDSGVSNIASLLRSMAESRSEWVRRKRSAGKHLVYMVTPAGLKEAAKLMEEPPEGTI